MDHTTSNSLKRKRGDLLVDEGTSPASQDAGTQPSEDRTEPSTQRGEHPSKKQRLTTEDPTTKPSRRPKSSVTDPSLVGRKRKLAKYVLPQTNTASTAIATSDEDQLMSDAAGVDVSYNIHTIEGQALSQPATAVQQATPYSFMSSAQQSATTPSALLRAADPGNPYIPSIANPQARAAYLQEVGTRGLYIAIDPLQTSGSAVEEKVRYVIKQHLCHRWTYEDCREGYNSRGGNANKFQSVEKAYKEHARHWFNEQDIVLPWDAVHKDERKRLKALGLGPRDFPTLLLPGAFPDVAGQQNPQPAPKRSTATKKISVSKAPNKAATSPSAHDQEASPAYTGREAHEVAPLRQANGESIRANSESQHGDYVDDDEDPEEDRDSFEAVEDSEEDVEENGADGETSIHDRFRAIANAFDEGSTSIRVAAQVYKIQRDAFYTYCGAIREYVDRNEIAQDFEVDLSAFPPKIVRAFIQAISPVPCRGLPIHDFAFGDPPHDKDLFSVINPENILIRDFKWDVKACLTMRDLAVHMDCPIIKDMVADELFHMYHESIVEKRENPQFEHEDLEIPLEYLNSLDSKEDVPFLRLLTDCLLHHANYKLKIPEEMADHVRQMIHQRLHIRHTISPSLATAEGRCNRYHSHGENEECYEVLAQRGEARTKKTIQDMFTVVRKRSFATHTTKIAAMCAEEPRDLYAEEVQRLSYDMTLWSIEQEEKVAGALLTSEVLKQQIANSDRADAKLYRKSLKEWRQYLADLRADHEQGWDFFERGWIDESREPDSDDEDEEEVVGDDFGPRVRYRRHRRSAERRSDGRWTLGYFYAQVRRNGRPVPARTWVPTVSALLRL
ncbi:uncharacterized protein K460DRAFT_397517 [Cucurbitaria berberidis CBS 394.84]|uniref:Uncharacterized protein n=1 Tax=Cucurbitaria berberidis CBS 394.84 TaxID=1168544 RepID=A0A9P4L6W9_9PLEO|nr:uncharacterized protein K460DRAFT_397517 [Cucurbitaria berberidis CBS 394.84]KAF1844416.1 hypothetical protein K460DRAFT_397517 [Cucurbitaria berberidis CBS 394.84]